MPIARFYIKCIIMMDSIENRSKSRISQLRASNVLKAEDAELLSNFAENDSGKFGVEVARQLVDSKKIGLLARNLSRFEWLDNGIADKLISHGFVETLAKNLSSFKNLSKKTAKILMEDRVGSVSCNLRSFEKLDNSVAQILINNGYYNVIARDIDMFKNLTNKTLLSLLVNCTKYRGRIMLYRSVFPNWWERNEALLRKLKSEKRDIEYKKLKEFYDKTLIEERRKNYRLNTNPSKWVDISEVKEAIRYWKWKDVIENLDNFQADCREVVRALIEWWCIDDVKKALPKLWWKALDWKEIVYHLSLSNDYNTLITYADNFKAEWVSNVEIGHAILKNCDLSCRDSVTGLADYSGVGEWGWDRVNYNLDFYELVDKRRRAEFVDSLGYFESDFAPMSKDKKIPLKLKDLVKQNLWEDIIEEYPDLFE